MKAQTIQIMEMCSAFVKAGSDVELLVPKNPVNKRVSEKEVFDCYGVDQNFQIRFLPCFTVSNRLGAPTSVVAALNSVRKSKPNFCYVRNIWAVPFISILRIPILFESHEFHYAHPLYGKLARSIVKRYVKTGSIRLVICISDALRNLWLRSGCPEEKTVLAPDGVDLNKFSDLPEKEALRAELGLPLNMKICCYCGHLYNDRGIEDILAAAIDLKKLLFLIVGGHPKDVEKYKILAKSLNIKNVTFTGFVSHFYVPRYLRSADILLMPHSKRCRIWYCMSPLKMFEYLAAGRPIIASDFPSTREVLKHGEDSILIKHDSRSELVRAIQRILNDDALYSALSIKALNKAKGFSWVNRGRHILAAISKKERPNSSDDKESREISGPSFSDS